MRRHHSTTRRYGRRLRVAYVSADLRDHAVSYLMAGVLEDHDRGRLEVTGISLLPPEASTLGRRVSAAFDRFVDVSQSSDAEVVALMRELQIDVAVDLMGYTHKARPGIFARRAAPVQVNYLGYPGTLGTPCIDYLLADDFVIPPESARHSVKLIMRSGSSSVDFIVRCESLTLTFADASYVPPLHIWLARIHRLGVSRNERLSRARRARTPPLKGGARRARIRSGLELRSRGQRVHQKVGPRTLASFQHRWAAS